jgi:Cu2+-containing amine oxidase
MASPRKPEKAAKPAKPKAKSAPAKNGKSLGKPTSKSATAVGGRSITSRAPDIANADPALFDPLTPGEAADALRTLTEDKRLGSMAKVGRYRVICTEPLVVKPPHWMAGHRLARVVAYDYSSDRCVDACIDLDAGVVAHLELTKSQPMLSLDEEALAVSVAMSDDRVISKLGMGEGPQSTMHYWGRTQADISFSRRSAAVIFGRQGGHATLVAVVDLLDNQVTKVVPAELW